MVTSVLKNSIEHLINKMFTFDEFSHGEHVYQTGANIFCPFHPSEGLGENKVHPAARVYENKFMRCFTTDTNYTCYDYIRLVLKEDPCAYLLKNKDFTEILKVHEQLILGDYKNGL